MNQNVYTTVENDHNFLPSASDTDSKYEPTTEIM